jgi:hypothetical protein
MVLILLSSFASAVPDGGISHYNFSTLTDLWGGYDLTNSGSSSSGSYPSFNISGDSSSSSSDFELSDSDFMYMDDNNNFSFTDGAGNDKPFSISFHIKPESVSENYVLFAKYDQNIANQREYAFGYTAGKAYVALYKNDGSAYLFTLTNNVLSVGNWYMITYTYDGSETAEGISIYINAINQSLTDSSAGSYSGMTNGNVRPIIGARWNNYPTSELNYDGLMDEVCLFNYDITEEQVANIYNYGCDLIDGTPTTPEFELTLKDAVGGSLSNFTADLTNSTGTTTITTTNGTIYYPNDQIVDITVYEVNNTGWVYQVVTNTSINTSSNVIMFTDVNDTINPSVTFNPTNGFNLNNFSLENQYDDDLQINLSFSDDRDLYGFLLNITRSGVSYFNKTNYTLSGTSGSYEVLLNTSAWVAGTYDVEIKVFDSRTLDRTDPTTEILNTATQENEWYRGNYTKIEPLLFSDETGNLKIRLTDDTTIQNISGFLYVNGTLQTNTTAQDVGSFWELIGVISFPAGTYDYYWEINITQRDGNISTANITGEITFYEFGIDDCSVYNYTSLYMNIFDEEVPENALNAVLEIDAEIWISTPENSRQFYDLLEGNSTYKLCLLNQNTTFYTDMYIKYTSDNGFTHRYYLVNETLTNETKNISMYNFNTTTDISDMRITVRNYDTYQYYPNVITKLQRRYPAEGVWRTVQMDESGDFGLVFFNIKEENTDYRILFYDRSNNLLKTTEKMKFICTSGVCELTFTVSEYSEIMIAEPVEVLYNLDNTTKILTVVWTDPDASSRTVRTLVTKETITGTATICDQTQTGASGTVLCNVSAYAGDVLLSVYTEDLAAERTWLSIARDKLGALLSNAEAAVWTFGIFLTIMMFGITTGAVGAIISTMIGLVFIGFLGIFSAVTMGFVIIGLIMSLIVGAMIRK